MDRFGRMGDKMMFSMFLLILIIITVGIVAGVYIFYGAEYDFRQAEADILNYNIKKCIINNDIDWTNEKSKENFFDVCRLNKEVIEKNNIIKICLNSKDCVSEQKPLFSSGSNFEACLLEGAKGNNNFQKCTINNFMRGEKEYEIVTGSNQKSRRING